MDSLSTHWSRPTGGSSTSSGPGGEFDGLFDVSFAGQVNGLVGAAREGGLHVSIASQYGPSKVTIVVLDETPPLDEGWEDIVEVSVSIPTHAEVRAQTAYDTVRGTFHLAGGPYRVRVSARGRDAGGAGSTRVVDFYLIEIWSAATAPDEIVRVGSRDADRWHRENGSAR